mgnify:FL=1|jgi:histidine triad (HIT) family protein|tara:strand:+ start:230 stop:595 length:366 start_codon:yes stop_codon:yes gene_type:complete
MDEDCVFCNIANGKIKAEVIVENENFIVFRDINPVVSGHFLLIPKKHYATFLEIPKEIYTNFMELAHDAVLKTLKETGAKGYNLVMNNDVVAGQVVHHSHLHIIPRKKDDGLSTFIGGKKH